MTYASKKLQKLKYEMVENVRKLTYKFYRLRDHLRKDRINHWCPLHTDTTKRDHKPPAHNLENYKPTNPIRPKIEGSQKRPSASQHGSKLFTATWHRKPSPTHRPGGSSRRRTDADVFKTKAKENSAIELRGRIARIWRVSDKNCR